MEWASALTFDYFEKCNTGKQFEKRAIKFFTDLGYMASKSDDKKRIPDLQIVVPESAIMFFVECKNYSTINDEGAAIRKWMKLQPKQYQSFVDINKYAEIYILLLLKTKLAVVDFKYALPCSLEEEDE